MTRLLMVVTLALMLASCSGGTGYLCIGRDGIGSSYSYECDGDVSELRDTEEIELESLSTSLGTDVDVTLTVSTNLGSVEVTVWSDGEPITGIVNAGVPLTLTDTAFLDTTTDSEDRRITVTFDPLGEAYRGRAPANGLHWALVLHPSE
jgi:hypothetical protein